VPLLALAGGPALAAALIFLERLGKGLRNPPRDALLAQAGEVIGHGRAFGLHELLDQIGALAGPLAVSGLLLWGSGDYRLAYAGLLVTALLALLALWRASGLQALPAPPVGAQRPPLPRVYFLYLAFVAVGVAGFGHFVLIAWVLQATHRVAPAVIPLLFALAMAVDAVAAYLVGLLHDRFGLRTLYALPVLALPATPLFFLGHSLAALLLATVLWGAALGLQESLMRAALARLLPGGARGFAYGLFDTVYGAAWFAGSLLLGALYVWRGALGVSVASVAFQVLAIALLPVLMREVRRRDPRGA
jgi:Arabinose efflux permease